MTVTSQANPSKDLLTATSVAASTSDLSVNTINSKINLAGTLKSGPRYTVIQPGALRISHNIQTCIWTHLGLILEQVIFLRSQDAPL